MSESSSTSREEQTGILFDDMEHSHSDDDMADWYAENTPVNKILKKFFV